MKSAIAIALVSAAALFAAPAKANKDKNPADYPLKAHVLDYGRESHNGTTSTVDGKGNWSYGTVTVASRYADFQIGNLIYSTRRRCKNLQVGTDVPARIEKDKLFILTGDDVCELRITGTKEAK